jgi:adenylate cyclase
MLVKRERAVPLIAGMVAMVLLMVLLQPFASEFDPERPITAAAVLAAFHMSLVGLALSGLSYIVHGRLEETNRRADALLLNVLPESIAVRLKEEPSNIADSHAEVTVLFADIVDFTPLSAEMSAEEVVTLLNQVFSAFDDIVADMGLEKIKTIGDAYMVAGGLPEPRVDHAEAVADFALAIRDRLNLSEFGGHHLQMRIGINSGPVVSGVIGSRKFAYDLWGDVVNTASRMETEGIAGEIQISESTHELIKDQFKCEPRGNTLIKGKGEMPTFVLTSRKRQLPAT